MKTIIGCLLACALLLTGCTGPFALTKALHKWQTGFDDKWIDEVAFLGCIILPAYSLTMLADGLILNSVEFWTGENPMDSAEAPRGDELCLLQNAAQI